MPKKRIKLFDKPAKFWIKVHIIGYMVVLSAPATYSGVNQIAFDKKETPKAKNAMVAQVVAGATFIFGGLAMWRKKEKQYE